MVIFTRFSPRKAINIRRKKKEEKRKKLRTKLVLFTRLCSVYITKMFLHNLSQRCVSALSWAIFRLNTFLREVNHTIDNVMIVVVVSMADGGEVQ